MARKNSGLEALISLVSKLPWWISALLSMLFAVWLHSIASAPLPATFDPRHAEVAIATSAFRGMATFGQFFVPLVFACGAVASLWNAHKRRKLLDTTAAASGNALLSLSWREFELLVGEALRRRGFKVQEIGGQGPDGGVDLVARKDGETYLVQCKHWRSVQVGVPVVRELYGAMAAEGAVGGFVVTSGKFTKQAQEFASGRNVQLVDGAELKQWMVQTRKPEPRPTVEVIAERVEPVDVTPKASEPVIRPPATESPTLVKAPACPFCRKTMVIKTARTGANAGGNFWGCTEFPKCRGIRPIFAPIKTI
ncbi:restriction endonuclease [Pseudomonas sp. GD03842]|nr:restriction endonuclease [Pseudomonas sp. GD03842]MDH0747585.1 restriction endonuclease [Pseudomonas sp. GD03842]RAU49383.1 restriction endonuclease [Pseudomonas sp. RIT 409]RAU55877.1 restriction endonuclease [Pseudomonas sp. RIT 412]